MAAHHKPTSSDAPRPVLGHGRHWMIGLPHWARNNIRARLQLSHLLTSLLPLLALGAALLYTGAQSEQRIVEQTQQSVVQVVATDVANAVLQNTDGLQNWSREVPLTASMPEIEASAAAFITQQALGVLDLAILDLAGNEIMHVTPEQTFASHQLVNRSTEPFFALARQGWTQREFTRSNRGRPVMQIALPTRTPQGYINGVIVAQFSTHRIEQRLGSVPPRIGRSAFLIDQSGTVLLGRAPEAIAGTPLTTWIASNSIHGVLEGTDDQQITVTRAQVELGPWFVVIEQPIDIAYLSGRRSMTLLVLMVILTTVIVIAWGVVIAREMTRPILHLRDGVMQLGAGRLGDTIEVDRQDELGDLAQEFNRMSERLLESQQAIEQRNARLSEGLALARIIQQDLLPHAPPSNALISACAVCEPATEIGGDFYTYVGLPDDRLRLIIGDASGKGVAAALIMALTSSLVEVHAREIHSPAELLRRLNDELYPRFSSNHMCTSLLVADFDPHTQHLRIANAGMIAPLVVEPEGCSYAPCYGPPLGIVQHTEYSETVVALRPTTTVVLVSDGIVEARDANNDMWGFRNLETTVCRLATQPVDQIVEDVLRAVREHMGNTLPTDDMTIITTTLVPRSDANNLYPVVPLEEHGRHRAPRTSVSS